MMALLEEGTYYAKLVAIGDACSMNGTPYIYIEWDITHQAIDGDWQSVPPPTQRTSRWYCSEKAEPHTFKRLEQLGWNGKLIDPVFSATPNPMTDGVELVCSHDNWDGKTYERWDLAEFSGGGQHGENWASDRRDVFEARYKTRQAATTPATGKPGAPPGPPAKDPAEQEHQDVSDDEIPF